MPPVLRVKYLARLGVLVEIVHGTIIALVLRPDTPTGVFEGHYVDSMGEQSMHRMICGAPEANSGVLVARGVAMNDSVIIEFRRKKCGMF